ncbi:MAG TPA: hypothetical protein PLP33_30365 [Leptospiraceae bacterium]|nr:hypothetical protein [Leptospiraceae bacterium]
MNYTIIKNESALREFIDWLPELLPHEKYYLSLLARNKYLEDKSLVKGDKISLKRFTSDKKYMFNKIKQLEIEIGAYTSGDNLPVPQESLALYITPNPRDLVKAAKNTTKLLIDKVFADYDGYNPHSLCLSEIQKSSGTIKYFDFDFDNVEIDSCFLKLEKVINMDACTFVRTRGGFHLLVEIAKIEDKYKKSWNPAISKLGCDVKGTSNLLPVPGTTQGGFIPILYI